MTQVIKNIAKRAFAMAGVAILAFAVLASGFSAALPAVALENSNPSEKYDPTKKEVLSHGHTDVFYPIQYNGKFIMAVEKDAATFLKPENTTLRVAKSTYTTKSQLPALATEYYYLDSSGNQNGNPLFPGWDTGYAATLVGASHADEATADIAIQQVTGPMNGRILLWTTEGAGKTSKKLSFEENDLDDEPDTEGSRFMLPGVIHQHTAGHVHANWGFTQPGVYKLKVAATITNKNTKKQITTEPAEYTFEVEDTYSGEVPTSGLSETLGLHRRGDSINPDDDEEAHKASEEHKDTDKDDGGDMRIGNIRDSGPHPHYHSYEGYGGLDLKVVNRPKGARIEWRYVRADEGPDAYGTTLFAERLQLPAEPAMNKMKVYAHATEGETQVGKDTASATIAVEDHGADGRPVVKAIAPYKRFKPGDTLRAKTALLNPHVATDGITGAPIDDPTSPVTSIVKDYVWLIKKEGESEFKRIPGAVSSRLELKLDASMQGATIRPSLVLKNGELYRNKMFDEFCDYVIDMGGAKHNGQEAAEKQVHDPDSEEDARHSSKRRLKKRRSVRRSVRGRRTRVNDADTANRGFVQNLFASVSNNGFAGGFAGGFATANNAGDNGFNKNQSEQKLTQSGAQQNTKSGMFGNPDGSVTFTPNFFGNTASKSKKLKRHRNNRNARNQNARNNRQLRRNKNVRNFPQNSSGKSTDAAKNNTETSGSFKRVENTSGNKNKRSVNAARRTTRSKKVSKKGSKKGSKNVRSFENESRQAVEASKRTNSDEDPTAQRDTEYTQAQEDDSTEDQESNNNSTTWVAAATGTASVGLCTVTGACSVLARPRTKLI